MENLNNDATQMLVVQQKPELRDQLITAAVGATITIVAPLAITVGSALISKASSSIKEKRAAKKEAKKNRKTKEIEEN